MTRSQPDGQGTTPRGEGAPSARGHRLVRQGDVRPEVHGGGRMGRFNDWLAVTITRGVGTMWAAYLFALIALISLPQALAAFARGDTLMGITWLSQSFLQLVLLPIIIVGQNVTSALQDARAEADHDTLTLLESVNERQLAIIVRLERLLTKPEERS